MEVFLGGTCAGSTWRDELIPMLKIDCFNPVVEDWNEEAIKLENIKKQTCDYNLFVITPDQKGYYTFVELTENALTKPESTICCILYNYGGKSFDSDRKHSLEAISKYLKDKGVNVFYDLKEVADFLNSNEDK